MPNLRAQNKKDKLRRIREAAYELFSTQSYDTTATRDIASRAKVGLATLFLYASDKRDLLFLACNDDLEELTERAFSSVDRTGPILTQLVDFFRHFYAFYGQNVPLSRDLLRELTFYTTGQQSQRFQDTRHKTISRVEDLVAGARQRSLVACGSSDADVARVVFYIFAAEIRRWLANTDTCPDEGLNQFEQLLHVVMFGLNGPSIEAQ